MRAPDGNGRLGRVTAVARVLPRDWDGHRLLRFLMGLAMLALAFAAHLAPVRLETAEQAPPAAVAVATADQAHETPAPAIVSPPALPMPTTVAVLVTIAVLVGVAGRVRTVRGPPLG